ncbi:alpha/beta fold hydrolase [Nonomuraea sp. LPB2021202275-12-8]|uniref:alpha/beta fold hydrolase n=1 Tax=Nonomuraea sp. LPB2021202275-12-8 TaxID=3120159 RepID=UPI00300CBC26
MPPTTNPAPAPAVNPAMDPAVSVVRSCDGTAIAVRRRGEGPVVVLVGGAPGVGERLAVLMAAGFTVFRYDRRGSGDSGDTAPYAVAREVEDLEAVVAAAGGPVCLAGLGSGAVLALEAARHLPAITRLAICGPGLRTAADAPDLPLASLVTGDRADGPVRLNSGFAVARWSCVAVPALVLDGEDLAGVLPDAHHRPVPALAPETLAPVLTEFFAPKARRTRP